MIYTRVALKMRRVILIASLLAPLLYVPAAEAQTDLCPLDPLKTFPGVCGCGVPDTDADQDGIPDCIPVRDATDRLLWRILGAPVSALGSPMCSDGMDNDNDGAADYPADFSCDSALDNDEYSPKSQCQDGIDNDGDGAIDDDDFACDSNQDDDEGDVLAECQDGIDNDGDGAIDDADFACDSPQDNDEGDVQAACQDETDNDEDGLTDLDDPGCEDNQDDDESDATSECQDGIDNDEDGFIDYPDDFSCDSPTDNDESDPESQCQDGLDNDGDGVSDLYDPGCADTQDNDESDATTECQDGIDNTDADGVADADDPGCWTDINDPASYDPTDKDESDATTECQDGIDNDGDGAIDYPDDFACPDATGNDEDLFQTQCQDGIDNDGDGATDTDDFSCGGDTQANNEYDPKSACQDGEDSDDDGLIDCADPGCHTDGNALNAESCDIQINDETHEPSCSDGVIDDGEQCDDGNLTDGDGCDSQCRTEVCGNGIKQFGEECDDGGTDSGDGCSDICEIEDGYICAEEGELSICEMDDADGDGFNETDGDCNDGDAAINPEAEEICDGIDNNCTDGVDEGFAIGETCEGVGECGSGVYECDTTTTTRCSTLPGGSQYVETAELCDGLDNDCDGSTDEDFENKGGECTVGIGECSNTGTYICTDDHLGTECSVDPLPEGTEECDGKDNDCDGAIDEDENGFDLTQSCYSGSGETLDVGICHGGTQTCVGGSYEEECVGEVIPATEICDEQDNDCDTLVDELDPDVADAGTLYLDADGDGYGDLDESGLFCGLEEGYVSNSDDCDDSDPAINPDADEICDEKDNDCDGLIDDADDVVTGAPTWYEDSDVDTFGNPNVSLARCVQPESYVDDDSDCNDSDGDINPDAEEICDTKDNDCNGLTDDADPGVTDQSEWFQDFDEDNFGNVGVSITQCFKPDGYIADSTDCDDTNGGIHPNADELCDGLDNDCNEETDEDFNVGETCEGVGECGSGVYECATTTTTQCNTDIGGSQYDGSEELCDEQDNDCDGIADEDFLDLGNSCNDGLGECFATGSIICTEDKLSTKCNAVSGDPSEEICDDKDNDCDGDIDEDEIGDPLTQSCYSGTGETLDVGICHAGTKTCESGSYGSCEGEITPETEVCDGEDNDCDNLLDEADPDVTDATTLYHDGDGDGYGDLDSPLLTCGLTEEYVDNHTDCNDENGDINPGATEICDEIDNNCVDGIDEGFDIGGVCDGVGACGVGIRECASDTETRCSTDIGGSEDESSEEICDTKDNDCDELTNEDFPTLGDSCNGEGECGEGTIECATETTTQCSTDLGGTEYDGSAELCDELDNDCDGSTDEDFPTLGDSCDDGVGECFATGTIVCTEDELSTECNAVQGESSAEVCDNKDNDCDGLTDEDEGGQPLTQSCYSGTGDTLDVGLCHGGMQTCESGIYGECVGEVIPATEICDEQDNDCDDLIDEADPDIADATTLYFDSDGDGYGDLNQSGPFCGPEEGYVANSDDCDDSDGEINPDATEVCDGVDNDCDTQTDEDLGQTTCGEGICEHTIDNCVEGVPQECNPFLGAEESDADCDGHDNNCNGVADEEYVPTPTSCGIGACSATGAFICLAGIESNTCEQGIAAPDDVTCNNIDDDCDGSTDEDYVETETNCGQGVCASTGIMTCEEGGNELDSCAEGEQNSSDDASCNGLDDDCDGAVDEDYVETATECGVGECAAEGLLQCSEGSEADSCTEGDPSEEICDGLDNDCDGIIDNNADTDEDGLYDCEDTCPNDPDNDVDADEVCGDIDNCPADANPDQEDIDGDGIGDACDPPVCGNGTVEPGEQCDDGNTFSADGCSAECHAEVLCHGLLPTDTTATEGNDVINGTSGVDVIHGLGGDDIINGLGGNDIICGGEGNDTLNGNAGEDWISGDEGNDTINGGIDDDTLFGGEGNDTINGNNGDDDLRGEDGNDTLNGGSGDDEIYGSLGDDILNGEAGNDEIDGSLGNDTIDGGPGRDDIEGSIGEDTIDGGDGDDRINGGNENDVINGGEGSDIIDGGIGDDEIHGNAGRDTIEGGIGDDILCGDSERDTLKGEIGEDILDGGDQVDMMNGGLNTDTCYNGELNLQCEIENPAEPSPCNPE